MRSEVTIMDKVHDSETGCCPRFDREPWDEKEVKFDDKLFVKDHVRSFFHIPLNFSKVMARNMNEEDFLGGGNAAVAAYALR